MEKINIFTNKKDNSLKTKKILEEKLRSFGYLPCDTNDPDAILNICIGGDGSFLRAVHNSEFSTKPFVGINTGTLGFFQEIKIDEIDWFLNKFKDRTYTNSELSLIEAKVWTKGHVHTYHALNDFVLSSKDHSIANIDVYIDGMVLEAFSGDGLIVSTPAGSTAYSFSVGGSILYQELKGYQLSPIAPINSRAYRSLLNSLVMSEKEVLTMVPSPNCNLIVDGFLVKDSIDKVEFRLSDKFINKLVFNTNSYWENLKNKFL